MPAIHWINEVAPADDSSEATSDMWVQDLTVYLIPDDDKTGDREVTSWIESNFAILFEEYLKGWFTDSSLWPQDITLTLCRVRETQAIASHIDVLRDRGQDVLCARRTSATSLPWANWDLVMNGEPPFGIQPLQ